MTERASESRNRPRAQAAISVRGAREHNLEDVDLDLPRGALVTFTGVSGSGKSSLAYDTIYKEGQRRFVESLSAYARQFLGQGEKPQVDHIEGLSPTVSVDQKTVNRNPRSTVGTITEVTDHLRLLFARLGTPHCPSCDRAVSAQTSDQVVDRLLGVHGGERLVLLAPIVKDRKGEYRKELEDLRQKGYTRARIDGEVRRLDETIRLERYERHTIEVVLDRLVADPEKRGRLAEGIEQGFRLGDGEMAVLVGEAHESFSSKLACVPCGIDIPPLEPRSFSFNSPHGACPDCDGLGLGRDVDLGLVVPDPALSIDEGAIAPSVRGGATLRRFLRPEILAQAADQMKVPRQRPFGKLTERQREKILFGSGDKLIDFDLSFTGERMRVVRKERKRFEGVVPLLRRLVREKPSRNLSRFLAPAPCPSCRGTRLRADALAVRFREHDIGELSRFSVAALVEFLEGVELADTERAIGERLLKELAARLRFLARVGLDYLTIDRSAATLSGGESQRIRLATQVGAGLRGILYVLDEPSIGLHPRDNRRLVETLEELRDAGNTVLVVEHDLETMESSDWLVDVGPGAGVLGGKIVSAGTPAHVRRDRSSVTGAFLAGRERIPVPETRRSPGKEALVVRGAREHNLKGIDVRFPLGTFIAVAGVSGSGKSTLIDLVLRRELARVFHGAEDPPGAHDAVEGLEHLDKVIEIDQSPIGRTPRSNPATYTKVWDPIRELFSNTSEAKARGYTKSRFSFNVKGGRCEECLGAGVKLVEMQFLADVAVPCEVCDGERFNPETLEITYREKTIRDVLEMTVEEAREFFKNHKRIHRTLDMLARVGLDYIRLGQPSTTLSGGEAQRVKLASELRRPPTGRTLYLLDEPTTGLHFLDVRKLLAALNDLVDAGNTVVVIEHDLDVVKCADWVIELGPEGGGGGGRLVYEGTVEGLAAHSDSPTSRVLAEHLEGSRTGGKKGRRKKPVDRALDGDVVVVGARLHNLRGVTARFPAGGLTVVTGPSGSGKTSLAFDTLFAEGQRRFVECLSTYARQFLGRLDRPPLDEIRGLAPAIAIDQKTAGRNPRSTVATATEIQDYLRLLWSRLGTPHCPTCSRPMVAAPPDRAVDLLLSTFEEGTKGAVMTPLFIRGGETETPLERAGELKNLLPELRAAGFRRLRLDGEDLRLEAALPDLRRVREIHLVVDRVAVKASARTRLVDSMAQAYGAGGGQVVFETVEGRRLHLAEKAGCPEHGWFVPEELSPRAFSFNSHVGACESCLGLGTSRHCDPERLVPRPHRPLFEGALIERPGDFIRRRSGYFFKAVTRIVKQLGADVRAPFEDLPEEVRDIVLFGSDERFELSFSSNRKNRRSRVAMKVRWKGLCTYIEEWHRSATSEAWLAQLDPLMRKDVCQACGGDRLKPIPAAVRVEELTIGQLSGMTVQEALDWVRSLAFDGARAELAKQILRELSHRLGFLADVGLEYLALGRSAATLSGGEAQRIRLATQIGNRLTGVIYVLDEPTIGLHPRDGDRLLSTLHGLRDLGNTVVVVEHDEATMRRADWIVDMGPGAGHHGGEIVFQGPISALEGSDTLTARYLDGRLRICGERAARPEPERWLVLKDAHLHNLRNIDVRFPLDRLTSVTGVSGSGKSTLVMESLAPALEARLARRKLPKGVGGLEGASSLEGLIVIDQSPIGISPKSNPVTYVKAFDEIRALFASAPLSKMRGYEPGRFSFNTSEGRCAACEGRGSIKVEMHFLPDVWVLCEECHGKRYNRETLAVEWRGKSIADVLDMEVHEAVVFFEKHRKIREPLQVLEDVGLGYLKLGQPATTLSGGEAQRVKLARELARKTREQWVYLLDEPTTGLHFDDVAKLVHVLHRLVDRGHTVILIEHDLDVIRASDHVIDIGPEGGEGGGRLVAAGTPAEVAAHPTSATGRFLARDPRPSRRPTRRRGEKVGGASA